MTHGHPHHSQPCSALTARPLAGSVQSGLLGQELAPPALHSVRLSVGQRQMRGVTLLPACGLPLAQKKPLWARAEPLGLPAPAKAAI